MMNKPLTPEERARIASAYALEDVQALLADAEFWRLAVRNAVPIATKENLGHCAFCGGDHHGGKDHEDDCLWKAAQE